MILVCLVCLSGFKGSKIVGWDGLLLVCFVFFLDCSDIF